MKYTELDNEAQIIFEWFFSKFTEGVNDSFEHGYDHEAMAEFLRKMADEEEAEAILDLEEEEIPELD